ncbi:hypothetical protein [Lysinibacillus sp. Ag94]|uniref:hypothetical protein n=1 Tax=Lysinibacillus sp. Ag94 TaxID=2936682 RepID=UPI0020105C79|nr:hypothetical protein [Lysinibacillus sp. Ag94]UPW81422.1 hypothetical protein MY533_11670 [Lysinibacillus sp. Ag94]
MNTQKQDITFPTKDVTSDGIEERLEWLPISNLQDAFLFPEFFKSELTYLPDEDFVTFEEKRT